MRQLGADAGQRPSSRRNSSSGRASAESASWRQVMRTSTVGAPASLSVTEVPSNRRTARPSSARSSSGTSAATRSISFSSSASRSVNALSSTAFSAISTLCRAAPPCCARRPRRPGRPSSTSRRPSAEAGDGWAAPVGAGRHRGHVRGDRDDEAGRRRARPRGRRTRPPACAPPAWRPRSGAWRCRARPACSCAR